MRIYWINHPLNYKIGMMARPRGSDWLEDDVRKLTFHNVNTVVSLLEPSEIKELGLYEEEAFCQTQGIDFLNYPIQDRGVPESQSAFNSLILSLDAKLSRGEKVVIHCRMGIGRTSMVCAALLIKSEVKAEKVFEILSSTRTLQVPDTAEQKQWVNRLFQ